MHFTIAGVKKIVRSTKVFVIQRFVISRFHCILSIHPKKKIFPASLHSKAFILLCKFETSWALLGRLSRGFCAISGASNFKQLFMTLSGVGVLLCESFLVESPNL